MTIRHTLAAALVASAIAAPAAGAMPAPPDMHASTAQAPKVQQSRQDLRSPDARDAAGGTTQAALAQERYYSSYGTPEPVQVPVVRPRSHLPATARPWRARLRATSDSRAS